MKLEHKYYNVDAFIYLRPDFYRSAHIITLGTCMLQFSNRINIFRIFFLDHLDISLNKKTIAYLKH
jgi:hypothetical protein